jgi:hypothetical protein
LASLPKNCFALNINNIYISQRGEGKEKKKRDEYFMKGGRRRRRRRDFFFPMRRI